MSLFELPESRIGSARPEVSPYARRAARLAHPTLAVATTEKGRVRETNAAWRALFALPSDVAVESHAERLFPNGASAERFERAWQATAPGGAGLPGEPAGSGGGGSAGDEEGRTAAPCELTLLRRDGSAFVGEVVVTVFGTTAADRPLTADAIWQVRDVTVERTLRRELRDLEDYHRELSRHQWDMTFVIDRKARISYASASVEQALGYSVNALLGEPFVSLLEPSRAAEAEIALRAATRYSDDGVAADTRPDAGFELQVRDAGGGLRVLACRPRDCFDLPRVAGMVIHARDITTEGHGRAAATGSHGADAERLRAATIDLARTGPSTLDALLDAVQRHLDAGSVAFWRSAAGSGAPGLRLEAVAGFESIGEVASSALVLSMPAADHDCLVVRDGRPDGAADADDAASDRPTGASIDAPVFDGGAVAGWLSVGAAGSRCWLEAEVDFVAAAALLASGSSVAGGSAVSSQRIDGLAGVCDRTAAQHRLRERVSSAEGAPMALLLLRLHDLHEINRLRGFATGDAVIARTARRLVETAGPEALVARVDGATFLVAVERVTLREAEALGGVLLQRVADVSDLADEEAPVDASVGIAHVAGDAAQEDAADGDPWLLAELALRDARNRGGNRAVLFNRKLAIEVDTRQSLDGEIEAALAQNQLTIFYQPQIALATGRVVGLEALLRWQHPSRGIVAPDAFMDVAFRRGLIDAITKTVLVQVCTQIATWQRAGDVPELPVAVNVSGRQFHDRRLPALVASALLKSGLPARLLRLEITEQSLSGDGTEVDRVVRELSRLGVRIAIGDFNVGHASFKYLRQLQVSQVKLDKGFIGQLPEDADSATVVAAVVEIARRLKYQVVAEGIETREQFEYLRSIGCEAGQGFYFGAPRSAADIRAYLVSAVGSHS